MYQMKDPVAICLVDDMCPADPPSVARLVNTEYMSKFLVWPDTQKRKSKRRVERQPFVVTSGKIKRCLRRIILSRLQKKRESKDGEGSLKKQNNRRRINFENVQLKGNFSKK
jgi:hypothetical protein